MNGKQLKLLGLVTAVFIIGAVWISLARKPDDTPDAALFPQLNTQLDKVRTIKLLKAGDVLAAELNRTADGWTLKQRNDYPADSRKINALLIDLAEAKLLEEKTATAANYPSLGVQDVSLADATGTKIELSGTETAIKLIVGKNDATANGTYVRVADQAQSWLIDKQLTVPAEVGAWLQRNLVDIEAGRIQEVKVQLPGQPAYSASKEKRDDNFDVGPLPKKRELNSIGVANAMGQALIDLQLEDVRPIAEVANESSAQASFHTFDGLIIDIRGFNIDDKKWITLATRYDTALAQRFDVSTAAAQPDASLKSASESGQAQAETMNKKTAAWAFAIADYKYDAIFKPIEQLLKKK
jgi:hypothetical protein